MLKLTKKQEEMLYLLRLDGLRREIELHEAKEAYQKAQDSRPIELLTNVRLGSLEGPSVQAIAVNP